ncbi:MAG: alpha-L-fucosidase [Dysgonamonadaceae bacterium]
MRKFILYIFFAGLLFMSCSQYKNTFFIKVVDFPENISEEEKVKIAAHVVPTAQQYAWQQMELTAFIHFGMNTFTNREWGEGTEDPDLFNPTDFNAEQWVSNLKETGFKMVILTAKHHDGFCLWPTKTTNHSVEFSSWRDGQGDVVREVKNACDKFDMKFGVYLSPWDRNAPNYGDSKAYNTMFINQLTELLSNYGEIHEVWFDGANGEGPNGKLQEYDWESFYNVIDSLQPKAVKAIMGNDVRWVGNEKGLGRETEWSVTPLNPDINKNIINENKRLELKPTSEDLGSRTLISKTNTLYWYPSEVDVSIRPGWFYHPDQDGQIKSLQELANIYFKSVGMNSVLLLNIPPDTRGQINEVDVLRLKEFSSYLKTVFENNKLSNSSIYWEANIGETKEFNLKEVDTINTIMLQEDIQKGQRVESFKVEGLFDNEWKILTKGTTIGYKRLLQFEDVVISKIRVTIINTRDGANIKNIGAYYAPPIVDTTDKESLSDIGFDWAAVLLDEPLTVNIGKEYEISGFTYNPNILEEKAFTYNFYVSNDNINWTKIISNGEFSNIENNPIPQFVRFDIKHKAKYFKFETISGTKGGKPVINPNQIGILTK